MTNSYCGKRFGRRPPGRIEQCRRLLANEINATSADLRPRYARMFDAYSSCFRSYRRRVDANCTKLLQKAIAGRRLRATKVVRATMSSMEPLLRALPSLRLIHLVRDPRSVTLSRSKFGPSGNGAYTQRIREKNGSHFVAEASLYCHHVIADLRSRRTLERQFPGRIMFMRYEDVVANPEQRFRDIYKLLDEPVPTATMNQLQKMAVRGQKRNLTIKWQKVLTSTDQKEIVHRCSEYYQLTGISPDNYKSQLRSTTAINKRSKH